MHIERLKNLSVQDTILYYNTTIRHIIVILLYSCWYGFQPRMIIWWPENINISVGITDGI